MGFTGPVSDAHPYQQPPSGPGPLWPGMREVKADLRSSGLLVLALAAVGLPAGVLWWLLAPRADYEVTADGPVAIGRPSAELLVADDAVFVLVVAVVGFACGAAAWWLRRRRGVATVVALSLGTAAGAALAWQVGEVLGAGPSRAELADVGTTVTTALTLASLPAIAVAPFAALLAYLIGTLYTGDDGLGRTGPTAAAAPTAELPAPPPMAEVPPPRS
jgi:hypothetical protein